MTETVVDFGDDETKEDNSKALALFNPQAITPNEVFVDHGLDPVIEKLKKTVSEKTLDISTVAGRKEIKSLARQIGGIKNRIDEMGAALKAPLQAQISVIDKERKRTWDEIEKIQANIKKDLDEWTARENARTAAHEAGIQAYADAVLFEGTPTSDMIRARISDLENPVEREWDEFKIRAEGTRVTSLDTLRKQLLDTVRAEQDAAELAQLRKDKEEREQKERDQRIADEAAAAAKKAAEEKAEADAKAERERIAAEQKKKDDDAEAERLRLKKIADDAEAAQKKAEQDKIDADAKLAKAEEDRIAAAKKAEEDKIAAQKKADDEAEAARIKAAADAKAAADKAVQDEKDRAAAEQKKKDDAAAAQKAEDDRRAADLDHKKKINNEILDDIMKTVHGLEADLANVPTDSVKAIIAAIATGKIRNVKVLY